MKAISRKSGRLVRRGESGAIANFGKKHRAYPRTDENRNSIHLPTCNPNLLILLRTEPDCIQPVFFAQIIDNLLKLVLTAALFIFCVEQGNLLDFIFKRNQFRYADGQGADRLRGTDVPVILDQMEGNLLDLTLQIGMQNRGQPVHMVTTRLDGTYVQERTMTHSTRVVKNELGYEKFDFHSLRHTHATELSEAGVNIKEIQRRLGHSTMDVTSKRYLHATKAMEEESVEKMNRMFGS